MKAILRYIPEIYLLAATIYYWILTHTLFNPIAIILLAILSYQLFLRKSVLGLIIAAIFILLNLYMILALMSELSEFNNADQSYYELLIFGFLFLGLNILMASFMLFKNIKALTKTTYTAST